MTKAASVVAHRYGRKKKCICNCGYYTTAETKKEEVYELFQ